MNNVFHDIKIKTLYSKAAINNKVGGDFLANKIDKDFYLEYANNSYEASGRRKKSNKK